MDGANERLGEAEIELTEAAPMWVGVCVQPLPAGEAP